jgi:hypothetical protein
MSGFSTHMERSALGRRRRTVSILNSKRRVRGTGFRVTGASHSTFEIKWSDDRLPPMKNPIADRLGIASLIAFVAVDEARGASDV